MIIKVGLSANPREISTIRWDSDLQIVHERAIGFLERSVNRTKKIIFAWPRPCLCNTKIREPAKHIKTIGLGLGRSSRRCRLGVRSEEELENKID